MRGQAKLLGGSDPSWHPLAPPLLNTNIAIDPKYLKGVETALNSSLNFKRSDVVAAHLW